jgi:hypothetical protein
LSKNLIPIIIHINCMNTAHQLIADGLVAIEPNYPKLPSGTWVSGLTESPCFDSPTGADMILSLSAPSDTFIKVNGEETPVTLEFISFERSIFSNDSVSPILNVPAPLIVTIDGIDYLKVISILDICANGALIKSKLYDPKSPDDETSLISYAVKFFDGIEVKIPAEYTPTGFLGPNIIKCNFNDSINNQREAIIVVLNSGEIEILEDFSCLGLFGHSVIGLNINEDGYARYLVKDDQQNVLLDGCKEAFGILNDGTVIGKREFYSISDILPKQNIDFGTWNIKGKFSPFEILGMQTCFKSFTHLSFLDSTGFILAGNAVSPIGTEGIILIGCDQNTPQNNMVLVPSDYCDVSIASVEKFISTGVMLGSNKYNPGFLLFPRTILDTLY